MPSGSERSSSHILGDEWKPDEDVENQVPENASNGLQANINLEGDGRKKKRQWSKFLTWTL